MENIPMNEEYAALSVPILSQLESVPEKPKKTRNKSTLGNTKNTSTPRNKGKKRKKSVLVAKTYKLPKDLINAIERIAYWRRLKIQDVVADALRAYIGTATKEELQKIPG